MFDYTPAKELIALKEKNQAEIDTLWAESLKLMVREQEITARIQKLAQAKWGINRGIVDALPMTETLNVEILSSGGIKFIKEKKVEYDGVVYDHSRNETPEFYRFGHVLLTRGYGYTKLTIPRFCSDEEWEEMKNGNVSVSDIFC